jgi:Tol biopolymer transport system component
MVTGTTTCVSVSSTTGIAGNGHSEEVSISADGQVVGFHSPADNLVEGDDNGTVDIFLHYRETSETDRVSVKTGGIEATGGASWGPSVAPAGRYVAFYSYSPNLVDGDNNHCGSGSCRDVFVHDAWLTHTRRVSLNSSGEEGNKSSESPSISAGGRFVAFRSSATNLVAGDTNGEPDIFVHGWTVTETVRVSVGTGGTQATGGNSHHASISADGRFVAFASAAGGLASGVGSGRFHVYVHDRATTTTIMVSVSPTGTVGDSHSDRSRISRNGRWVVFASNAENLVSGDNNERRDVFVYDLNAGLMRIASVSSDGTQGNADSSIDSFPSISEDGRFVAFQSSASNLVPGDNNGSEDIFVHDLWTGHTFRVSVSSSGEEGNGNSEFPAISADGCVIAFHSRADNLAPVDNFGKAQAYVHEWNCPRTRAHLPLVLPGTE